MTELRDAEANLRRTLDEVATRNPAPVGLAQRLVREATAQPERTKRQWGHVSRSQRPLLAAAAVILVALGATATLVLTGAVGQSSPAVPVPSTVTQPAPTQSAVGSPTLSPSPAPTQTVAPTNTASQVQTFAPVGPVGGAVPAGFRAWSVSFIDGTHGWALGNATCTSGSGLCAAVLRTRNGGVDWVSVPAPKGITAVNDADRPLDGGSCGDNGSIYGPCVNRVTFANTRVGYLSSFHSLFMTTDGGATWVNENARASQLIVVGDRVFRWSYVHECSAGCPGRLDVADLGSSKWQQVQPGGEPSELFGSSLSHAGNTAYFEATAMDQSGPVLYGSTDGGLTWDEHRPCAAGVLSWTVASGPDGTIVQSCSLGNGVWPPILVSTNGGLTFSTRAPITDTNISGSVRLLPASATDLNAIVSQQNNLANKVIFHSGDGGSTWKQVLVDPKGAATQVAPAGWFGNDGTGVITKQDGTGVYATTDGGATWQSRSFG